MSAFVCVGRRLILFIFFHHPDEICIVFEILVQKAILCDIAYCLFMYFACSSFLNPIFFGLEVANCDLQLVNFVLDSSNMKSSGNRSISQGRKIGKDRNAGML